MQLASQTTIMVKALDQMVAQPCPTNKPPSNKNAFRCQGYSEECNYQIKLMLSESI
jgi:hypothetical protein